MNVLVVLEYRRDGIALTKSGGIPEVSQPIGTLFQLGEVDHRASLSKYHGGFSGCDVIAYLHDVTLRSAP